MLICCFILEGKLALIIRDVAQCDVKETMKFIMKDLDVPFEGKPVKTKLGLDGYIKKIRSDVYCKYIVKCFKSTATLYLRYVKNKTR